MELTKEDWELILGGLGSLMQDNRFSPTRQHEAQTLAQKIRAMQV
jgi:hypothetical protein